MRSLALKIPPGDLGTDCTVAAMKAVIEHAEHSEWTYRAAQRISMAHEDLEHALYVFLRDARRFVRDPRGIEHVRHPDRFLPAMLAGKRPGMDCDDLAIIGATLLRALGFTPAVVVLGRRPAPAVFHHVIYASFDDNAVRPLAQHWPDNEAPAGFTPWDPQEAARVPPGRMAQAARYRVYPV